MLDKFIIWTDSLFKPKIIENNDKLYISQKLVNQLNDYLTTPTVTSEISNNLQQIQIIIENLNKYYAEKNWGQVAVNIRKLSDFTKTLYNMNNGPLSTILQSSKWIQLYALDDVKNLQRIDQKLEAFPIFFEEIESSREFANSELHISSNTKPLIVDLQMLPSQPAINFLVNIAIEGANFQETRNENTFNVKWESIFKPLKLTNSGREELEKPILHISQDKRSLDSRGENDAINNDIAQYLFNNNKIQYIDENTDTFKLLNAFWNYNWIDMIKIINTKISGVKKKDNPSIYYQLKLSEAWTLLQLNKKDQAINIWEEIEKECPKEYPHIRKLILNNLRNFAFTDFSSYIKEINKSRYEELQQYNDITIVDDNIRFNKSNVIETINKEFDFKNGKTRTLGQETRQFFLYNAYLPHLTKSICVVLEKGMFFMLPELLEDLIDLSIMQYQYYGVGNQRYFFMLHNLSRNIYGFNPTCLERYFSIIPLWDLQNHIEEIQPLINNILSSKKLKVIDLKFLKIIVPILNNEQQLKITQYAKSFFENPEVAYGDNYFAHAVWGEYLRIYFTILELNQSLWKQEQEQEWIITELCTIDVIILNNPLPFIERLIHNTKFPISDELLDKLCELIKNQKDHMGNPVSEYELISRISNIYTFYNKKLSEKYQNIFRNYESLWLYSNRKAMSEITTENINQAFKYVEYIINEYYKYDQKSSSPNEYCDIPRYIGLYISFIEEHKDIIDYEQSYKDIEKLWIEFLDFCKNSDSIPFQLLLEIQSYLIYFASENKFVNYQNIDCYINFDNWKDKVHTYFTNEVRDKQEYESSMIFLGAILHHIYNINDANTDDFHKLLNSIPWPRYHYCKQGIVNWSTSIPVDIKYLLKIKILDMISISQTELIGEDIINVYKILFENTDKMNSLQQFKNICSFPIYYEIDKKD